MRRLALIVMALLPTAAFAQHSPSPGSVNNCTQLTDPTQLRQCIESQQGVSTQGVDQSSPYSLPAPATAPILRDGQANTRPKQPSQAP